jgi:hypothetical protein
MFRSRFSAAFPRSVPHFGPHDIEKGASDALPTEQVEKFLCALLGLVLNRKKDVEYVLCLPNKVPPAWTSNYRTGQEQRIMADFRSLL